MTNRNANPDWLFYDGACALCHGAVKFVIARDADGSRFRFAPLGGDEFRKRVRPDIPLPDSVVVLTSSGRILLRSDALSYILRKLGGAWIAAGWILALLPRFLGDRAYDLVARVRYLLFRRPATSCPLLPSHLASRFYL